MRWMLVLFFVMIGVSGCQSAVEAPAPLPEPTSMPAPLLPAPLYFIEADSGQLMRMERDGATIRQVTHETAHRRVRRLAGGRRGRLHQR
ncbi:MAG: hypothetical protein IPM07_18310 [Anaerolineales bacterium]|nr:hypothetical protein [Anaerolineales bacterium]